MLDHATNHPLDADMALLKHLGLPIWQAAHGEEILIGEVQPYAADEPSGTETTIQVYVRCYPAQFFRFVVVRQSEAEGYDGMEQVEVRTGSGSLSMYWPMVLSVAGNALTISPTKRLA